MMKKEVYEGRQDEKPYSKVKKFLTETVKRDKNSRGQHTKKENLLEDEVCMLYHVCDMFQGLRFPHSCSSMYE